MHQARTPTGLVYTQVILNAPCLTHVIEAYERTCIGAACLGDVCTGTLGRHCRKAPRAVRVHNMATTIVVCSTQCAHTMDCCLARNFTLLQL